MWKLLIALDGSDNSDRVVDHVIKQVAKFKDPVTIHLLNVQLPLIGVNVKLFISRDDLEAYYQEEGMALLKRAREKLDAAAIKYECHVAAGAPPDVIVQYVKDKQCDQIVMGSRGMGTVANMVLGSVATKTIHLADVPILLVK